MSAQGNLEKVLAFTENLGGSSLFLCKLSLRIRCRKLLLQISYVKLFTHLIQAAKDPSEGHRDQQKESHTKFFTQRACGRDRHLSQQGCRQNRLKQGT